MFEVEAVWYCGYCGEENPISVDPTAGALQVYVEDCAVCCHPNTLTIHLDSDLSEAEVDAVYEG